MVWGRAHVGGVLFASLTILKLKVANYSGRSLNITGDNISRMYTAVKSTRSHATVGNGSII